MAADAFIWAGRINRDAAASLGSLRLIHGMEAAAVDEDIWVRAPKLKSVEEEIVHRVPWKERYELLEGEQLRSLGRLLSDRRLPNCTWKPLAQFLCVRPPSGAVSGRMPASIDIKLRPISCVNEPNLLEASSRDWLAYAEAAGEIRLRNLTFAVDERDGERVLIRGVPLPSLPGAYYTEANLIATPAGYSWYPRVSPNTLRTALAATDMELIILRADNSSTRIPRSAWVSATRGSVRLMLAPERYV